MQFTLRPIRTAVAGLALTLLASHAAAAQSLNVHAPTALSAGENTGTVDSLVGPQYWMFHSRKGSAVIDIRFSPMGLFGNPGSAAVQVVMLDTNGKMVASTTVAANGKPADVRWPGTFAKPGIVVLEIRPPMGSLVRAGGDYSISVTGAVDYAGVKALGPERIAGTYSLMTCPPTLDCQAVRFFPNGTVKAADGTAGTWTAFDPAALIYTVQIGQARFNVKLAPGRGLMSTDDPTIVVFQAIR